MQLDYSKRCFWSSCPMPAAMIGRPPAVQTSHNPAGWTLTRKYCAEHFKTAPAVNIAGQPLVYQPLD